MGVGLVVGGGAGVVSGGGITTICDDGDGVIVFAGGMYTGPVYVGGRLSEGVESVPDRGRLVLLNGVLVLAGCAGGVMAVKYVKLFVAGDVDGGGGYPMLSVSGGPMLDGGGGGTYPWLCVGISGML